MEEMVRTHVLVPRETLAEFDRRVGDRHRSERVTQLIEDWLRRERAREVYGRFAGSLKIEDHPEWADAEATEQWVRAQREEPPVEAPPPS